LTGNRLG